MIAKHSHTLIAILLMCVAIVFNVGIFAVVAIAAFFFGREHSQAEYRYMNKHGVGRRDMDELAGFNPNNWNYDSFVNDFLIPSCIAIVIYMVASYV